MLKDLAKNNYQKKWNVTYLGYEIFYQDISHLTQVYVLKYEDLINNSDKNINGLFDFLELEHSSIKQEIKSDVNIKYFDMWEADIKSGRIVQDSEKLCNLEARASLFGYSLFNTDS